MVPSAYLLTVLRNYRDRINTIYYYYAQHAKYDIWFLPWHEGEGIYEEVICAETSLLMRPSYILERAILCWNKHPDKPLVIELDGETYKIIGELVETMEGYVDE